ncbi:F-box/kelch-repeat protein At3g23880-like [Abrus precatorius]|uniref:F-box/kelch-repeat protein At3g23880-like n=1 Tax=Abrus precatorius TaxID=3816 RepID=A0A8B8L4P1_ABRPR|nr:F-box/kelch-repeat protein At3g23880-like [Abrus precatorius]
MSRARCSPALPEELIVEILSWVSVKHLMRMRCVCKSWKSMISDPTLVKLHLERSSKEPHVILTLEDLSHDLEDDDHTYAIPYSVNHLLENPSDTLDEDGCYQLKTNYWVVGSCNGLVCLYGFYVEDEFDKYWVRFWNPATRMKSKKSPCLHVNPCCRRFRSFVSVKFGFGYDDSSDTYKVVFVLLDCRSETIEVIIHCMGDNYWRKILNFPSFPILEQNGLFVNGTVNWLALDKFGSHYQWEVVTTNQLVIFSFDLQKETYKYLSLPDGLVDVPSDEPNLVVLRDCLCLFYDDRKTHFVVWQMREFGVGKSWNQLVKVSYEHLRCEGLLRPLLLLCISENGDVLLLLNNDDTEVITYNRRSNTAEHTEIPNDIVWWKGDDYFQSLVLPCPN